MSYLDHAPFKISRLGFITAVVSLQCFLGCGSSTKIDQAWTAPEARYGQFHKVVTLFIAPDGALRRSAEDRLAYELSRRGVQAIPAYQILSDAELHDFGQSHDKLLAAGVDGVVAMRALDKETQIEVVPPTFDGYWGWAWPSAWDPGYAYTYTIVRMETNAYSVPGNKLMWSAVSETVDPSNSRKLIEHVTKVVATALERQRLVAPPNVAAG